MKPSSLVYWTRVGAAILVGSLCHFLGLTETMGLFLCLIVFVGSAILFERGLHLKTEESKGPMGSAAWTTGIGTYYILWILVWTLLNTVLQ